MTTQPKNPCRTHWQRKWLALDAISAEVQAMADKCERWALALCEQLPPPRCLVIAGAPGCGKTHVAKRLYAFACAVGYDVFEKRKLSRPLSCVFHSWPVVVDGFKEFEFGAVEDMCSTDVLFLDDIGAENDTHARVATDKLCQILSRREGRFTVITTNIEPKAWKTRFDERVFDRLFRGTRIVDMFKAQSYALKK